MGIASTIYHSVTKRTSTFALAIIGGTFVFERVFDESTNGIYEYINRGKLWMHIKHKYEVEDLSIPLVGHIINREGCPVGWRREIVVRKIGSSKGKKDLYFYAPCGKKLRSRNEIISYISDQNLSVDIEEFDLNKNGNEIKTITTMAITKSSAKEKKMTKKRAKEIDVSKKFKVRMNFPVNRKRAREIEKNDATSPKKIKHAKKATHNPLKPKKRKVGRPSKTPSKPSKPIKLAETPPAPPTTKKKRGRPCKALGTSTTAGAEAIAACEQRCNAIASIDADIQAMKTFHEADGKDASDDECDRPESTLNDLEIAEGLQGASRLQTCADGGDFATELEVAASPEEERKEAEALPRETEVRRDDDEREKMFSDETQKVLDEIVSTPANDVSLSKRRERKKPSWLSDTQFETGDPLAKIKESNKPTPKPPKLISSPLKLEKLSSPPKYISPVKSPLKITKTPKVNKTPKMKLLPGQDSAVKRGRGRPRKNIPVLPINDCIDSEYSDINNFQPSLIPPMTLLSDDNYQPDHLQILNSDNGENFAILLDHAYTFTIECDRLESPTVENNITIAEASDPGAKQSPRTAKALAHMVSEHNSTGCARVLPAHNSSFRTNRNYESYAL